MCGAAGIAVFVKDDAAAGLKKSLPLSGADVLTKGSLLLPQGRSRMAPLQSANGCPAQFPGLRASGHAAPDHARPNYALAALTLSSAVVTSSDRTLNRSAARRFTPPSFDERAGRPGVTLP